MKLKLKLCFYTSYLNFFHVLVDLLTFFSLFFSVYSIVQRLRLYKIF